MKKYRYFQNHGSVAFPSCVRRAIKRAVISIMAVAGILGCFLLYSGGSSMPVDAELTSEGIPLPVIMYHSVLKDPEKAGTYVVSPEVMENDLRVLKARGYESIVVQDLIDYVHNGVPLPQKPVMITLDDGYYNNLTYVLPILEKLDMRAVISVVGIYTEKFSDTPDPNPNYAHLSFADISTLTDSGRVEIQNHSYDMHSTNSRRGTMKKEGESSELYKTEFCNDVSKNQQILLEHCGLVPTAFVYPFGYVSEESEEYLKELGFSCSMICYEKLNLITDEESLFNLCRFNRPSGIDTEAFLNRILPN